MKYIQKAKTDALINTNREIQEPVAVLGAGVEGKSTAWYLKKHNFTDVTILDVNKINDVPDGYVKITGKDYLANLSGYRTIFRSPGIRPDIPQLLSALKSGSTVTSAMLYFLKVCNAQTFAVTGTAGKGTACSIAANALKSAGFTVHLGGNIGTNPLTFLDDIKSDHKVILEVSSFQAMDLTVSPDVGVVLKTTSEHLNWHRDTDEYRMAKAALIQNQLSDDVLIFNGDSHGSKEIAAKSDAKKFEYSLCHEVQNGIFLSGSRLILVQDGKSATLPIDPVEVKLKGLFNLENIAAAILMGLSAGADINEICKSAENFRGLEHRLEFVSKCGDVKFYNDSYATRPDATIAALKSFKDPLALILGGSEKNADFAELIKTLFFMPNLKSVQLIGQTSKRLKSEISANGIANNGIIKFVVNEHDTLESAMDAAINDLEKQGIVLLSPACASFGMFKNYKERGDIFKHLSRRCVL